LRSVLCSQRLQGQAAIEYAVLVAIVVAALVTMQVYVRRGISGKLRAAADSVGEPYDPRNTTTSPTLILTLRSDTTTTATLNKDVPIDLDQDGFVEAGEKADVMVTTTTEDAATERSGGETVGPLGTLWN